MSSDVKIYPRFPQSYFYTKRFVVLNYRMKINYSSDALSWHSSCRITSGVTLKSSYIHLGSEKTIYLLELIFYCAKNIAFDVFLPWFIDKSTYRAGKDGYQNIILGDYTIFLYWDIVLLYVFIMQTSLFAAKSQALTCNYHNTVTEQSFVIFGLVRILRFSAWQILKQGIMDRIGERYTM